MIEAVFHQIDRLLGFKEVSLLEVLILGLAFIIVFGIWPKMDFHVLSQEGKVAWRLPLSPGQGVHRVLQVVSENSDVKFHLFIQGPIPELLCLLFF